MLKEQVSMIEKSFLNYFFDGRLLVVVLIALLFLLIEEKQKDNKNYLVYYTVIIFLLFLNPIFSLTFSKVVSSSTYYRFLWLIPLGIIIAYFGTVLISKIDKKFQKILCSFLFIGIIIYSGESVYSIQTFEKVNNPYKLLDEIVQVVDIINTTPQENKKAMVSTNLVGYIRQLDASIKLPYPRRPYGNYEEYFAIVKYYNHGDVENLTKLCKEKEVNIIVYDNQIELTISPSYFGYDLYAQTTNYDIYVLKQDLYEECKDLSNIEFDEEIIKIDGLKNQYKICFLNDLHIIESYDDVSDSSKELVDQRKELFKTQNGEYATDLWKKVPSAINSLNSDLVVFGGDMLDYISSSNIECLKNGMTNISSDIMYLRADHDYAKTYNNQLTQEYIDKLEESIDSNLPVFYKDLGEILVVGINNSTSQISDEALRELKQIFQKDKPIILATHVPLNSKIDNSLADQSKNFWRDRNLTWDEKSTSYIANDNTKEFLKMVYAENSPVKAVLAGHLHFKHTGNLNENIIQYVFDATYNGKIGILKIVGN